MHTQINTAKPIIDYFVTPAELAIARRSMLTRCKSSRVAKDYQHARTRARMDLTITAAKVKMSNRRKAEGHNDL